MIINVQPMSTILNSIDAGRISIAKPDNDASIDIAQPSSFAGAFQDAISKLQKLDSDASEKVTGLLSGDGTDIHTAMIATQKASLAFEAVLAVRNKAVGAYQQLMGMQF